MIGRFWLLASGLTTAIVLLLSCSSTSGPAPTFTKAIAPILFTHCAGCHRPGQGAPFSLLSFDDARAHADEIAEVTESRRMPPWLPAAGDVRFADERRLTDEQIRTLHRWAAAGAPEGNARDLPARPVFSDTWQLGSPDLVVSPAKPFTLSPGAGDVFRNLVISGRQDKDRFIRAIEFAPGPAPIHHAVLHLDSSGASRQRDGLDGQPGFDGMGAPGTQEPDGHFVGWAPGRGPIVSADGAPWRLARGTDFVLELHLIPGTTPVTVKPTIALYFADVPPARRPLMFKMGSNAIDIPAGATGYAISDRYVLPVDADLLSLYPHAHFLGKDMQVSATLPDGTTRSLLHIPQWSFHWQQDYRLETPLLLPRGTTIEMRFTYDNSDRNPDNPHRPPVRVVAGQRSTDEMGNLLLQLVPHSDADRAALTRDVEMRQALANLAGASALVAQEPGNARAHSELGAVLLRAGRVADAVASFRRAVTLSPNDARLVYNLGKGLSAAGDSAAAETSFERALVIDRNLAEAHDELGVLLFARGQLREALTHLRRAVELAPDSAVAHSDFGGALAQSGDYDRALAHIRRALELDPDNAAAKENLARLRVRRPGL